MTQNFRAPRQWRSYAVALLAVATLGACAPLTPQPSEYQVGRTRLVLPEGAWQDQGTSEQSLALLPEPDGAIPLQTRTVALRGPKDEVLAVLVVQTNRTNYPREDVLWTGGCPQQREVIVEDATKGGKVRVDCLRVKRWASSQQWMEKNHPAFAQWLDTRKLVPGQAYSYIGFRYATEGGALVTVDAAVDQRLLNPKTRNNQDFLVAGRPSVQWGHDLAQAVRVSTGMMDGYLAIPPFPFPLAR